jgi:hypothetical protein
MRSLLATLALMLLLCERFTFSNAFATWLQCYVDLDDTEIVMNHKILAPEDAPHIVHVQVRPAVADANAGAAGDDENDESEWMSTLEYPAGAKTRIHAMIQPPPEATGADASRALQWVMETTDGATFLAPSAVCNGSRSNGANQKEFAVLEINGETDTVQLWAAWAGGHEPVSLTPRITLTRAAVKTDVEL